MAQEQDGAAAGRLTPAERDRLAEIVLHAAGLETGEREGYLRKATTGAPQALWVEARRRLASAADLATSFLGEPIGDLFAPPPGAGGEAAELPEIPALAPEERYLREEKLGEGGMARVYRAHDRQLERPVAPKLLDHPDPAMRRRLLHEARAQARVHHDNVLEVYDTGELEGTPYISMHYVAGHTLLELRSSTSLEEQVRLLEQVAEGLHAAHREGLLHRDVKPSNVLVEDTPDGWKPLVADFGIAVLEEPEDGAAAADRAGTPYYMAPERLRAGAAIDRRSDVYSLGVTMYQLFSGELPFDGTQVAEGLRKAVEEEPRSLRALVPELPAELEAITGKCLAKDPDKRYPSARAVAEDLRRYLDGEVVEAHAATLAYRLTKFALRNKLVLSVAAAAAVLLIGVLAAFAVTTERQSRRIASEAERANREAGASQQVSAFMVDLFEVSDPGEARGNTITAREILDRGAERIRGELDQQPLTRARLMDAIGRVFLKLGLYGEAEPLLAEALDVRQLLLAEHLDLAASLRTLADLYQLQIRLEQAEPLFLRALVIRETQLGPDHPEVAEIVHDLATLYRELGRNQEAEPLFQRALAIRETRLAPDHPDLAEGLHDFGIFYAFQGRYAEADELYRRALAIRLENVGSDHLDVAMTLNYLGQSQWEQGRLAEAEEIYLRSLAIRDRNLDPEHPDVAMSSNNLAMVYRDQGRYVEAESLSLRAVAIWKAAALPEVGYALYNLGVLYTLQGRYQEAESLFRTAQALGEKHLKPGHRLLAYPPHGLGNLYREQQRYDQAELHYQRALAIREKVLVPGHPHLEKTVEDFALLLRSMGRDSEAGELESPGLDLEHRMRGEDHPNAGTGLGS